MSISTIICDSFNTVLNVPGNLWQSCHTSRKSNALKSESNQMQKVISLGSKFFGRTVTLLAGAALTSLACYILAKTPIGGVLGITGIVTAVSNWPLALTIGVIALGAIGTAILSSYLIEKFV